MELKHMTNQQIAKRMYDYIIRIESLMEQISKIMEGQRDGVNLESIRAEYRALKQGVKEDAHYMSISRNQIKDNSVLQKQFNWVIGEASAFGFETPTNGKIDGGMWRSLAEARYKLTKHTSTEEWKNLSEVSA